VFVVLGMQHAKRMRRFILPSVACLAAPYFSSYFTNGTIFGKKVIGHIICFDFFLQSMSETFLILRSIQRDIIMNVHMSSCKIPVFLIRF
jgi:hypothetical protein